MFDTGFLRLSAVSEPLGEELLWARFLAEGGERENVEWDLKNEEDCSYANHRTHMLVIYL